MVRYCSIHNCDDLYQHDPWVRGAVILPVVSMGYFSVEEASVYMIQAINSFRPPIEQAGLLFPNVTTLGGGEHWR